jgi:hypothetical protein
MTVSGKPHRPHSDDDSELGFIKAKPVSWLSPSMLINTAGRVVLSDVFGEYLDKRDLQQSLSSEVFDERDGADELWFDYVADVGDGFDPTYTIAYLLGQSSLRVDGVDHDLPRGRFLMMGGDEVYPTPTPKRYEDKTKGPYEAAMPLPPAAGPRPNLYALPGNHDWYDGLTSFMRIFAKDSKDHIGGWCNTQARSYFAIQLPQKWWLFAIDEQFGAYLDDPQLAYFHAAASKVAPGDRVIVCTPTPSWVEAVGEPGDYDTVDFFVRTVLKPTGADIKLMLSGDLHHYARYAPADGDRQLIHCGGGGAYLYPTHRMPKQIPVPPPAPRTHKLSEPTRTYELKQTFPTKSESRKYALGVFGRVPTRNIGFIALLGSLQTLFMLSLFGLFEHLSVDAQRWLELPIAVVSLLILAGAAIFANSATGGNLNASRRVILGSLHGLAQIALGVLGTWAWVRLPLIHTRWPWPLPATAIYFVVMGVAATLVFCAYLLFASLFGVNVNELFAGQSIIDSKSFLRLHIAHDGTLTIYPIGVRRVSRRWRATPTADPSAPWLEPKKPIEYILAEDAPITIR